MKIPITDDQAAVSGNNTHTDTVPTARLRYDFAIVAYGYDG